MECLPFADDRCGRPMWRLPGWAVPARSGRLLVRPRLCHAEGWDVTPSDNPRPSRELVCRGRCPATKRRAGPIGDVDATGHAALLPPLPQAQRRLAATPVAGIGAAPSGAHGALSCRPAVAVGSSDPQPVAPPLPPVPVVASRM